MSKMYFFREESTQRISPGQSSRWIVVTQAKKQGLVGDVLAVDRDFFLGAGVFGPTNEEIVANSTVTAKIKKVEPKAEVPAAPAAETHAPALAGAAA